MRVVLALLFVGWTSSVCAAQDQGPPPEYRGIVDSALEEFDAQHWAEARTLFERAHAIFPNARTLRGIGMAAFELRDYVAARRALDASLVETRRALTDEQRTQVSALAERARLFVGDFGVGPAPDGSFVEVDGVRATLDGDLRAPTTIALAVGTHELTLRAPDGRTEHAQVTVHGGEHAELALVIEDEPARAPEPATIEPPPSAPPASPGPPDWAWGLTIGGGALVIVGAILVGVGASDAATISNAPRATEWADLEGAYARATPLEITGGVALGVGVAAAVAGIVGLATSSERSIAVGIGPGALTLRGTF
jgi:hypothetical protein